MQSIFYFTLILILFIITYQDFKLRMISWWTLPLVVFLSFLLENRPFDNVFSQAFINMIFILINLIVITIYFSIKNSRLVSVINSQLGIGDVFLFVVFCFMFSVLNYILFFLLSMLLSVLYGVIFQKFTKQKTIPLAGIMAFLFIVISIAGKFASLNIIQNENWVNTILKW